MKTELIAVGRTSTPYISEGISNYLKRLVHYTPFELRVIPDLKNTRGVSPDRQCELEGISILGSVQPGDTVVLLDEKGREMTSREFAAYIDRKSMSGVRKLVFVIGGPYGFSPEVYDRADDKLSLSRMTFSHEMVRLFFVEQVYRAMTILRGEPYHHD